MSYSTSPDGPWSKPVQIFANYTGADTNFAPVTPSFGKAHRFALVAFVVAFVVSVFCFKFDGAV